MFNIRRIYDSTLLTNRTVIQQVQQISKKQFPGLHKSEIRNITDQLQRNGPLIGTLKIPILVVQEGGYNQKNLGRNARVFFQGLRLYLFNLSTI